MTRRLTVVAVKTGAGDNFPVQQGQLQRWTEGRFVPVRQALAVEAKLTDRA